MEIKPGLHGVLGMILKQILVGKLIIIYNIALVNLIKTLTWYFRVLHK